MPDVPQAHRGGARPVLVVVAKVEPMDAVTPLDSYAQRVYPHLYLKCRVCGVEPGKRCVSLSGHVVDGRPDGVPVQLDRAHGSRRISRARR